MHCPGSVVETAVCALVVCAIAERSHAQVVSTASAAADVIFFAQKFVVVKFAAIGTRSVVPAECGCDC